MASSVLRVPSMSLLRRFAEAVTDPLTITWRNLLVWSRVPAFLISTLAQPVMFVLMFRYVFGGAIQVGNAGGYVDFLIPGIIAQSAVFASIGTAMGLAEELKKGVIDRLRSMPIDRSAVLTGRLTADAGRMLATIAVMVGIGYAVGFRFHNGVGPALGMVGLATAFGLAFCCIAAFIGLALKDQETAQPVLLIYLFPFTFISNAFVPVGSMPGWLQAFANHQPVSQVIGAMRAMALGGPIWVHLWQSLAWLIGIMIVFGSLAARAYRRA